MIEWWRILLWSLPAFFALGALFFLVALLRAGAEVAAGAWRVWVREGWRRFWRSRSERQLMRFSVFRRWVP